MERGETVSGHRSIVALAAFLAPVVAFAQAADVPYVATPMAVVDAMLDIAKVNASDFVIDLGSGDGRIVIEAAKKRGAHGFGVDLDGSLVSEAKREAERQGLADKVDFHARNLFITDIARATVLTTYLFPSVNLALRPRLFAELKPGTRVVSHDFDFGRWRPDAQVTIPVPGKRYGPPSSNVYLWLVPANAAGTWRWELAAGGAIHECELKLEQTFQTLRGSARIAGQPAVVERATLNGDRIEAVLKSDAARALEVRLSGRIAGEVIEGRAHIASSTADVPWNALRTTRGEIQFE